MRASGLSTNKLEDGLKIENAKWLSMFISLSKRSLEQRFFFTPVIGVFVYHECMMRRHAEMGDVLTGKL